MSISSYKIYNYIENKNVVTADIFISNICNLKCEFCRYEQDNKYMNYELFVEVIERLKGLGVRGFNLTGKGEPLLNPDIEKILEYLNKENISYGINSNFINYVENIKAKWIKINVFKYYYKKIVENIDKLRKENKDIKIGVQMVVNEEKRSDLLDFWCKFKYQNIDNIIYRPIEQIGFKKYDDEVLGFLECVNKYYDDRVLINEKFYDKDMFDKCVGNWSVLTVDCEGNVLYCCHKNEIVGSLFDDDILDKKNRFKSDMNICENPCRLSGVNKRILEVERLKDIEFI